MNRRFYRDWAGSGGRAGVGIALAALAVFSACRDQEAPGDDMPPVRVGPATVAGVNLDANASPQTVAATLLRVLKEDVAVSRQRDAATFKRLLSQELQLAAPRRIYRNLHGGSDPDSVDWSRVHTTVYKNVSLWASIVARYVDSFPETPEAALAAMRVRPMGDDVRVSLDVTDSVDNSRVVLQIYLCQEPGADTSGTFWRVFRIGFAPFGNDDPSLPTATRGTAATTRTAGSVPATQATP